MGVTIDLTDWQSDALRAGSLMKMRFPKTYHDSHFAAVGPKDVFLRTTDGILDYPYFVRIRDERLRDFNDSPVVDRMAAEEGCFFSERSYIDDWNERFPDCPYDPSLMTTVVELSWAI